MDRTEPAAVSGGQVLSSNATSKLSSTAARYLPLGYSAMLSSTDVPYTMFPAAGTITKLRLKILTAPTGTQTWTAELKKNGSATGFSCTVNSSSSGKCSTTGSVSFAAGDYASVVL